jgi:hypothetical protein
MQLHVAAAERSRNFLQRQAPWLLRACLLVVVALSPELASAAVSATGGAEPALAYIDPGTGSFLVQALIAALAGAAVTIRLYWSNIKSFFGGSASEAESADDDE